MWHRVYIPRSSWPMPLNTISSSPFWHSASIAQSSACRPLSSGLDAHRKTRVLRLRAYPSDLTWSVNENMLAAGFSNVSNDTFGVYPCDAGDITVDCVGDCETDMWGERRNAPETDGDAMDEKEGDMTDVEADIANEGDAVVP